MESAERSWYLGQLGITEWIPRDAAALMAEDLANKEPARGAALPLTAAKPAAALSTAPQLGPSDILARLKASNGSHAKRQMVGEGSKLAAEFTKPPTQAQLKHLAEKSTGSRPPPETTPLENLAEKRQIADDRQSHTVASSARAEANWTTDVTRQPSQTLSQPPQDLTAEPDFTVGEVDSGDLEALFAEAMSFEHGNAADIDSGPDSLEKLDKDWKRMLAQAGCLPASLGEGAKEPKVLVLTALEADRFDSRQLDKAWRLRRSILNAAKLPETSSFHASLYSISKHLKPLVLLQRLRALYPEAILLCFATPALEDDVRDLAGEIIVLPSLDEMLKQPQLKRQAWERLQKVIPVFERLGK